MHYTDNQQSWVFLFFDWKVFGKEEEDDKCVCRGVLEAG